jgi:hypothetical protein
MVRKLGCVPKACSKTGLTLRPGMWQAYRQSCTRQSMRNCLSTPGGVEVVSLRLPHPFGRPPRPQESSSCGLLSFLAESCA